MGITSPVLKILLLSKTAKFPFLTMDYSPWSAKNLMDWNWLKKFMHVWIDEVCMYGLMRYTCAPILVGVTSSVSEILLLSKTAKFPFRPMDNSPWSSKILINRNWLKKFMHVGFDVKCMHTNFGGRHFSGFGDIATFKNG